MKNKINNKGSKVKWIWIICWLISLIYALAIISVPILYLLNAKNFEAKQHLGKLFIEYTISIPFRLAGLITFIFWIYNLVMWNKRKDRILILLLLLFLNILYTPVYYYNKEIKSKSVKH
jgi:hypothetical protein